MPSFVKSLLDANLIWSGGVVALIMASQKRIRDYTYLLRLMLHVRVSI